MKNKEIIEQINRLKKFLDPNCTLKIEGWDGYDAVPINDKTINIVINILSAIENMEDITDCFVSPTCNGTFMIEIG